METARVRFVPFSHPQESGLLFRFLLTAARGQPNPAFHLSSLNACKKNRSLRLAFLHSPDFCVTFTTAHVLSFFSVFFFPMLYTWPLTRSFLQHYKTFICNVSSPFKSIFNHAQRVTNAIFLNVTSSLLSILLLSSFRSQSMNLDNFVTPQHD